MKVNNIDNNSYTLYLDTVLRFGKYKGNTLKDVIIQDIDYVLWLIRMYEHPIDKEVRQFVKEEFILQGRQRNY